MPDICENCEEEMPIGEGMCTDDDMYLCDKCWAVCPDDEVEIEEDED